METLPKMSLWDVSSDLYNPDNLGIENICFGGGGARGIAYPGVIKALNEYKITSNVKAWSGSSAGSIAALFGATGAPYSYIRDKMNMDLSTLVDYTSSSWINKKIPSWLSTTIKFGDGVYGLIKDMGMARGKKLMDFLGKILIELGYHKDITFYEFYRKVGVDLVIPITSPNTYSTIHFSRFTHPTCTLVYAVRASCSIPYLFRPMHMKDITSYDHYLVDGGFYENCPINVFDYMDSKGNILGYNRRTLSFILVNEGKLSDSQTDITGIKSYTKALYQGLHSRVLEEKYKQHYFWERTIPIECGNVITNNYNMSEKEKMLTCENGYLATMNQLGLRAQKIKDNKGFPKNIFIPCFRARCASIKVPDSCIYDTPGYSTKSCCSVKSVPNLWE